MNTPTLPEWYSSAVPDHRDRDSGGGRRASLAVRRALADLGEALAHELTARPCDSWLTGLEPRAKVGGILMLVIGATVLQQVWLLAGLLAFALALAVSARVTARRMARIWLGVPLFSLAIIVPATLNLVTDGPAVLTLWHFAPGSRLGPWALPSALTITQPGLMVAGRFVLRSLTCVTLVQVLVATTEPTSLLGGLRRLGMPRAFGMVLTMSHRYLAVLLRAAEEIHLAKLSRTIAGGRLRYEQRWVAAGMGMLFRRSHRLAQEVNQAMVSRGYDGDLQVRPGARLRPIDWAWLAALLLVSAGFLAAERLT